MQKLFFNTKFYGNQIEFVFDTFNVAFLELFIKSSRSPRSFRRSRKDDRFEGLLKEDKLSDHIRDKLLIPNGQSLKIKSYCITFNINNFSRLLLLSFASIKKVLLKRNVC